MHTQQGLLSYAQVATTSVPAKHAVEWRVHDWLLRKGPVRMPHLKIVEDSPPTRAEHAGAHEACEVGEAAVDGRQQRAAVAARPAVEHGAVAVQLHSR